MSEATNPACNCCGFPVIPWKGGNCPRCHYPVNMQEELLFLEVSINHLRRVAQYGGANLTVSDLIGRYQSRLNYLVEVQGEMAKAAVKMQAVKVEAVPEGLQAISTVASAQGGAAETTRGAIAVNQPGKVAQEREHVFSLRTFLAEQTINILASLGAFIGLAGALSFVATTTNLWLSFVVLFLVQAVFGGVGIGAYRFASFRVVTIVYTVIFALLVPLVGFSGYRLAQGHLVPLSSSTLLVIAMTYAALVYCTLAVCQRFKLFGYFGITALTVADFALVRDFNLELWWCPVALMFLAFPAALALPAGNGGGHPFTRPWTILREPVLIFAFVAVAVDILGIFFTTLLSYSYDGFSGPNEALRLAILCMNVVLLLWTCLALRLTKSAGWLPILAYLFLACVLALCYAFAFQPVGYILVLTAVALLYHGLNRFAPRAAWLPASLPLQLDLLALLIAALVAWIAQSPLQLIFRLYGLSGAGSPLSFQSGWVTALECLAVALCCALTVSIALRLTGASRSPAGVRADWCWTLLLSGFLLNWLFTVVVLDARIDTLRAFFVLALVVLATAVLVRQHISTVWSHPLDVVAAGEVVLTLLLGWNQSDDITIILLLFFAVVLYGILLYQRRFRLLVLPTCLGLLALPLLLERPRALLVAALLLPFAAAIVRQLERQSILQRVVVKLVGAHFSWEWPLLALALIYSVSISLLDTITAHSTIQGWLHLSFPIALEVACFAPVWYASAALARMRLWLIIVAGFASAALLFPTNPFWAVAVVTLLAIGLVVGVKRLAGRTWALPLYAIALLGAIMAGYTGGSQHQPLTGYVVLAFAVLAFLIMLMERVPELLICPAGLAVWAILRWQPSLPPAFLLVALSLLCLLVFVSQFVWKMRRPVPLWLPVPYLARLSSIGGQVIVVLAAIEQGGLATSAGGLAHVGAGTLLVLALLLFWYGRLQSLLEPRRACDYGSCLLASFVISWELIAFRQSNPDLLLLAPATYLIVIAPWLSRDAVLPASLRHRLSQWASLTSSLLLLLPTLWLSFGGAGTNLLYTLILIAEALALLLLGIGTRLRVFILSGAALMIVGTLRILFLPVLGLPPSLALTVLGALLLAVATALSLARHRLRAAWVRWE